MIYQTFAEVYDRLMDQSLYPKWRDYVLKHDRPNAHHLLDLAGGSGFLAVELAKAGRDVTVFDLSAEMLALASQKADEAQVGIDLIQGDMLDLQGMPVFETVTCFDDSICYLPDQAAVKAVFDQVAAHLEPGGNFFFDAHSLYQMDEIFPGYMYNEQTEDFAFLWHSYEGALPHSIEHDLTFFLYDESIDAYKPLTETHKERTYPLKRYKQALQAAGFQNIQVTADFGAKEVSPTATRWFFQAQRS